MDYQSALEWLYATQARGIKLGLHNSRRLLDHFCPASSLPHPAPFVFHVAGTNGKGSVCAFLESMLLAGGYRSGMLTSPHLVSFTERIRINGKPISQDVAAQEITRLRAETENWDPHPTFFELTTVLGYCAMLAAKVEGIVLETGMGGRLDSTNAIASDVTIITSIALDHQASLGHSLGEIAFEKAGIIKPGKPVVFPANLPPEAKGVILEQAANRGSPVHEVLSPLQPPIPLHLAGKHQYWNAALALRAFALSPFRVPLELLHSALARTQWPARFQRFTLRSLPVIIDGAHNPAAAQVLTEAWRDVMGPARPTLLFGTVRDKDPRAMLDILRPCCGQVIFTDTPTPRGNTAAQLALVCGSRGDFLVSCPAAALETALNLGEPVLITGSLFLAGKFLQLVNPDPADPFEPSLQ